METIAARKATKEVNPPKYKFKSYLALLSESQQDSVARRVMSRAKISKSTYDRILRRTCDKKAIGYDTLVIFAEELGITPDQLLNK
jgi:transcriptional regulator with XRE-family HTH domain